MIKNIMTCVALSTLMVSGISSASETYFRPAINGSGAIGTPWTFSGSGSVQRGFSLICDVDVVLKGASSETDGHGTFSHTDVSDISGADFWFSDASTTCNAIGATDRSSAGPVTFDPVTHEVLFYNTKISTITLGYCEGTLQGTLDPDTHTLSITGSLPGFDSSGTPTPGLPCVFSGSAVHSDSTHTGTDEINEENAVSGHTHTHTH